MRTLSPNDAVQQAGTRDKANTVLQGLTRAQLAVVADLNYVDDYGMGKATTVRAILNDMFPMGASS